LNRLRREVVSQLETLRAQPKRWTFNPEALSAGQPSLFGFQTPPSPSPRPSPLGEGEPFSSEGLVSDALDCDRGGKQLLPLPKGEGRGEGKGMVRSSGASNMGEASGPDQMVESELLR